ncbi:MAG TPA: hypothetical protein VHZ25_04025 [Acidobacteriaceae bacterium]|jgi:hypothetical protein|nr:hypothetical protein [Acidobacteriaceae bacterium]
MKKKWVKPVLTRLMKPSVDTKAFMAAHPEVRVVPVPKPAAEFATDATLSDPRGLQPADEE